jgi:hypothetical protein
MTDLKGAVTVAGSLQLQFEVEGLLRVGRSMTLAFRILIKPIPLAHRCAKGHIAGTPRALLLTSAPEPDPAGVAIFLLLRLVLGLDDFIQELGRFF